MCRVVEDLADVVRRAESVPQTYEARVDGITRLTAKLAKALQNIEVGVVSVVQPPEPLRPTQSDMSFYPFDV